MTNTLLLGINDEEVYRLSLLIEPKELSYKKSFFLTTLGMNNIQNNKNNNQNNDNQNINQNQSNIQNNKNNNQNNDNQNNQNSPKRYYFKHIHFY